MREVAPFVFVLGLAVVAGSAIVLRGPIGQALAEWIRGWSRHDEQWLAVQAAKHGVVTDSPQVAAEVEALRQRLAEVEELQQLRREVAELAERVDFVERLQATPRNPERLARGPQ